MFAKDDLIAALRLRYDHYSAQGAYDRARERAGLADKPELDAKDVRALRGAIEASKDRVDRVLAHLDALLGEGGSAKAEEPAKTKDKDKKADKVEKAEDKPAEKPVEKPAEKAAESDKGEAAEAKPEPAKAEAKGEDKPAEAEKAPDAPAAAE